MTTHVPHRTHARAAEVTHRAHAMRSAEAGSKARAVTHTSCSRHLGSVASANVRGALAMDRRGALTMNRLSILRVHGRVA